MGAMEVPLESQAVKFRPGAVESTEIVREEFTMGVLLLEPVVVLSRLGWT